MQVKTTWDVTAHATMPKTKNGDNIKCWWGYEKTGLLIAGGNINGITTLKMVL